MCNEVIFKSLIKFFDNTKSKRTWKEKEQRMKEETLDQVVNNGTVVSETL